MSQPTETAASLAIEAISSPADLRSLDDQGLARLSDDVRAFLIDTVSRTGGHIGANLGTVDLTVALHSIFESPGEPIIWDTGHQGYTHKILTGRADRFPTLNTYGGMSRFVSCTESEHDRVEASHAGTSLSIASGIALSRKIKGDARPVVAVIGDSALAEGMALEALNHIAVEDINLTIVLNDNGYAISPGFGGIHELLQSGGARARAFFEAWGIQYHGPVDGHDVAAMRKVLGPVRAQGGVHLVHAKTVKGYGWAPADGHPFRMHFSFPFDKKTGAPVSAMAPMRIYPDIVADVLLDRMDGDDKVVCITPSTLYATGLAPVFARYPSRCFDPGMEEQHAMGMAVGMAMDGLTPVVFYQSTFMQRAYDQLFHDVCFANKPMLICAVRSGFAGYDNPTHHGVYDFPYLRSLPNLRILYPKDRQETERMARDCLDGLDGPVLILMPYGPVADFDDDVAAESPAAFSAPQIVETGEDLTIITVGNKFAAARDAAANLREKGVRVGLVNLRILKPLPEAALRDILQSASRVAVVEEYVADGGVGGAIAEFIADNDLSCALLRCALPCAFIEPGSNEELEKAYRLDANGIVQHIRERWGDLP